MHKIDSPSATEVGQFTEGSPAGGVPATTVTAAWLNDIQEELVSLLAAASIVPVKGDQSQVLAAIQALLTNMLPKRIFSANDFVRIPDVPGGLIIQWGLSSTAAGTGVLVGLPTPFPNSIFMALATDRAASSSASLEKVAVGTVGFTNSGFYIIADVVSSAFWLAIGN